MAVLQPRFDLDFAQSQKFVFSKIGVTNCNDEKNYKPTLSNASSSKYRVAKVISKVKFTLGKLKVI